MRSIMRSIARRVVPLVLCTVLAIAVSTPLPAAGSRAPADDFARRFPGLDWDAIVSEARGQRVYFNMWGGSEPINRFVSEFVADRVRERYGVELVMVPVTDASVFVNAVLGERLAGRISGGSVDLMWINGENFRTMRQADLLFGPYSHRLPNMRYVNPDDPAVRYDFGVPVDGFESPYGSAQFVLIYDSARVPQPPRSVGGLLHWIRANPGRFTYPAVPDFTGSVFLRHLLYSVADDPEELLGPFDQAVFDRLAPRVWEILRDIAPYLWRQGRTYPETSTAMQDLFANGEIWFDMNYNPAHAANMVEQGRYPRSTRTMVFEDGTIGANHFVAIPFNASAKAGALVVANALLDPEVQLEKSRPEVWGDFPAIDVTRLDPAMHARFAEVGRHPSSLPPEELFAVRLSELQADWLEAIEAGWVEHVLQR